VITRYILNVAYKYVIPEKGQQLTWGLAPVTLAWSVKASVAPAVALPPLVTSSRVAEAGTRCLAEKLTSTLVCW